MDAEFLLLEILDPPLGKLSMSPCILFLGAPIFVLTILQGKTGHKMETLPCEGSFFSSSQPNVNLVLWLLAIVPVTANSVNLVDPSTTLG